MRSEVCEVKGKSQVGSSRGVQDLSFAGMWVPGPCPHLLNSSSPPLLIRSFPDHLQIPLFLAPQVSGPTCRDFALAFLDTWAVTQSVFRISHTRYQIEAASRMLPRMLSTGSCRCVHAESFWKAEEVKFVYSRHRPSRNTVTDLFLRKGDDPPRETQLNP